MSNETVSTSPSTPQQQDGTPNSSLKGGFKYDLSLQSMQNLALRE